MTLSETREQISALEGRLNELKDEKHQVFLQLKKVLNEDETRKRQLMSQEQQTRWEEEYKWQENQYFKIIKVCPEIVGLTGVQFILKCSAMVCNFFCGNNVFV